MTTRALLGLGSNLGNRIQQIQQAVAQLSVHPSIELLDISQLYETRPVNMAESPTEEPGWFINAALLVDTDLSPQELLRVCLETEQHFGRERPVAGSRQSAGYASRTLDIDILFYDSEIIREPGLEVPHPRLHERAFILAPLIDIAAEWSHPILGKTLLELYHQQDNLQDIIALGTPIR